jgi:hypothetical protein
MKVFSKKLEYENMIKEVLKDPEYTKWFNNHLDNRMWTKNLQQVNKNRIVKYATFWTLVGGGAGLKTFYFIKKLQAKAKKDEYKKQLDAAKKTPVSFKDPVGTKIPIYTWDAQSKTWKYANLNYKIEASETILKVKQSADKTHTLLQFPDKQYYWVLTNTLSTAPVVKKKPETPKKVEPVKKKEPIETTPVTPTPVTPETPPEAVTDIEMQ